MKTMGSKLLNIFIKFCVIILLITLAQKSFAQTSSKVQSKIESIQKDIEEIRGAKFKHTVKVENQSVEDFGNYLDKTIDRQFPRDLLKNYGKIVKKLGLYRGPEIKDFRSLAKAVLRSQAAAYYDPKAKTFYLVMQNLPEQMLNSVYAHELYHGFQDQYHELTDYIVATSHGQLNDDELLARQAVVEGEATYLMTLWTMKNLFGAIPDPAILRMSIAMQSQLHTSKLLEMLKSTAIPQAQVGDVKSALKALDTIPPFMLETMLGAYLKGMAFIFEIQQHGWEKVDQLYKNPPVSSEQILHPEKWLKKERPYKFEWPEFINEEMFADWRLLESNTLGEIQWRIIFAEHHLPSIGDRAAAGWDGDSFVIFENEAGNDLLLLIYTSWDSEKDANEFRQAYQQLLKIKYQDDKEVAKTEIIGKEVLIIEGGEPMELDNILAFMKRIRKAKS